MTSLNQICDFLDHYAPTRLAEDWDNVGLLAGDTSANITRVMTCLTITPESAEEAIARKADLIVTHHPLPFQPLKKLTLETTTAKLLWNLIGAGVAIYSPHTGFDSAASGINQMIAERIGLQDIVPIVAEPESDGQAASTGAGRIGMLQPAIDMASFISKLKQQFAIDHVLYVGDAGSSIAVVASACGSGGSLLAPSISLGCDTFVTGEASFHTCLEAKAKSISMVMLGHYSSERFAVEALSNVIQSQFADLEAWCSAKESDPVKLG